MGVHRSRYELERVLGGYGASDVAFVEADANASIQFALEGRYVQLALPLPDPAAPRFTHTAGGRPRTIAAQERAYEQALREHWRALLLSVRGKLQSVESGISTFEAEFAGFMVPHFQEDKRDRRKKPRAVNWLLGSSHTLAITLVAAFLVPASAVSAFALPPSVVDRLSAPFRGTLTDGPSAQGDRVQTLALGVSRWNREVRLERDPMFRSERVLAPADLSADVVIERRPESTTARDAAADRVSTGSSNEVSAGSDGNAAPVSTGGNPSGGDKPGQTSGNAGSGTPSRPPAGNGGGGSASAGEKPGNDQVTEPMSPPNGPAGTDEMGADPADSTSADSPSAEAPSTESPPTDNPPAPVDGTGTGSATDDGHHDNGNHNGADNGNKNGADNGNKAPDAVQPGKAKGQAGP